MALSKKDLDTILSLIKIDKVILKRYRRAGELQDKSILANQLLPLIYMENDLLTSLDVDEAKLEIIEKYFEGKVGLDRNTKLLYGTLKSQTDENYAYYRIVARLRSMVLKSHPKIIKSVGAYLTDCETALLYRNLIEEGKRNAEIRDGLENYAIMILMNSPEMEVKILENGLNPLEKIYDACDIITDYLGYSEALKVIAELGTGRIVQTHRTSDSMRTSRFNEKNREISQIYIMLQRIHRGVPKNSAESTMIITYLKTIIALLDKKRRRELYEALLSDKDLKDSKIQGIEELIKTSIEDIEMNIVPYIENVTLLPILN